MLSLCLKDFYGTGGVLSPVASVFVFARNVATVVAVGSKFSIRPARRDFVRSESAIIIRQGLTVGIESIVCLAGDPSEYPE